MNNKQPFYVSCLTIAQNGRLFKHLPVLLIFAAMVTADKETN